MTRIGIIIFVLFFSFATLFGQDDSQNFSLPRTVVATGTAAAATALSNADLAYLRTRVSSNTRGFKGAFGENIAQRTFLENILEKSGNWKSLTPRLGSQGLDHVFVKYSKDGLPKQLMVAESKYGSSRLGFTKDGIQMGRDWINKRLIKLGKTYSSLSNYTNMKTGKVPFFCDEKMEIHLKNGKTEYFWRNNSREPWKFSGTQSELAEAQTKAKEMGHFLDANGRGIIEYRSRIFHISVKGNDAVINIYDAKNINPEVKINNLKALPQASKPFKIKNLFNKSYPELEREITKKLLNDSEGKLGVKEARQYARKLVKEFKQGIFKEYSLGNLAGTTLLTSIGAGAVAAALDAGIQFLVSGKVDVKQLALTGGAVAAGALIGQGLKIGLTHLVLKNMITLSPASIGLISSMGTIIPISAFLSYGNWLAGNVDLLTATINFGISSFSGYVFDQFIMPSVVMPASIAVASGLLSACGATASTGVAIGSLSGAAAKSATLAWLGGGSLASGGLGVAGGMIVLTSAAAVAALALAAAANFAVKKYDEYAERQKIEELIRIYSFDENMERLVENSGFFPPSHKGKFIKTDYRRGQKYKELAEKIKSWKYEWEKEDDELNQKIVNLENKLTLYEMTQEKSKGINMNPKDRDAQEKQKKRWEDEKEKLLKELDKRKQKRERILNEERDKWEEYLKTLENGTISFNQQSVLPNNCKTNLQEA